MTFADLARSIPGIIAVGLLPGFLLASALRPLWHWWQRLASAPGLAAGIVGVVGLSLQSGHLRFRPVTVIPTVVAISVLSGGIWALRMRRHRSFEAPPPRHGVVVVAALVAGLLSAGAAVAALTASPLPPVNDAPIHALVAVSAERQQALVTAVPDPADGATISRPRAAVEGEAVVVSWLGGPSPALVLQPLTLAAVVLLPLGLAWLVLETTRDWRIAATAPLLAIGIPFPHNPLSLGEFPLIVDSTLVVPLVVLALRGLRGGVDIWSGLAVGALTLAVWVTHGLELLTALLIAAVVLAGQVRKQGCPGLRRLATLGAAAVVGAGAGVVLTRLATVPTMAGSGGSVSAQSVGVLGHPGQVLDVLTAAGSAGLTTPVAAVLLALGVVAIVKDAPRARWAVGLAGALLLMLADVGYLGLGARLWVAIYPWAVVDRLVALQYWAIPVVLATGLVAAPSIAHRMTRDASGALGRLRSGVLRGVCAAPRVALGIAVVAGVLTVGWEMDFDHRGYSIELTDSQPGTTADVRALASLDAVVPPGTIILTNRSADAGEWIDVFTHAWEYAPAAYERSRHGGSADASTDPAYALANACTDPATAAASLSRVQAVYVGSRQRMVTGHGWNMSCVSAIPGLRRVVDVRDGGAEAAVFIVEHSAAHT